MGLGKSLQALTIFCIDAKKGLGETLLIVCPVSLRANWAEELEKFTRLPYTLLGEEPDPFHRDRTRKIASPAKREAQLLDFLSGSGVRVLVVNYEQLTSKTYADLFARVTFDTAIYDEAHYIKNPTSARAKASFKVRSTRSFMLTGTPMLNGVHELWSLFHKVDPVRWPKYWTFVGRYCVMGGYKNKEIVATKNSTELIAALQQVMIRRVKKDVLTLPIPNYVQMKVGLNPTQQSMYDKAVSELTVEEVTKIANPAILMLRLKQICNTPYSVDPSLPDASEKLDLMVDIAEEVVDKKEKLVIFTQFRGTLACIVNRLGRGRVPLFELHGDVPAHERVAVVNEWSRTDGPAVLACMTQVAGVGLNMTAAKTCIFVDKLFVPGLNQQAVDRLHRIGASTTQPIQVFELICRGTVEDRIERILRTKSKIFDEVVEGSDKLARLIREALKEEVMR